MSPPSTSHKRKQHTHTHTHIKKHITNITTICPAIRKEIILTLENDNYCIFEGKPINCNYNKFCHEHNTANERGVVVPNPKCYFNAIYIKAKKSRKRAKKQ